MDVSASGLVQAALATSGAQTHQAVQVSVLKKALNLEAANAQALLQALPQPAQLPLAQHGNLGTQLNVMA
ncbi:MAG TPA: putative motility protein [Burkholderiaceae bacterium]|mgnify:CR=1 FL=1|nr:putative motility protein [Burkholderiaceae bacterium]